MKESQVLLLTAYELTLAIAFGMTTIVLATKLLNRFVLSMTVEEFIRRKHVAGCLISAALVFSVVFLTRGSVEKSTLALQSMIHSHDGFSLHVLGIALAYFAAFYAITFILSFFVLFVISKVYRLIMKKIDFDHEIEIQNNVGLSIFLSGLLVAIVLFIDAPIGRFLSSLVFHEAIKGL